MKLSTGAWILALTVFLAGCASKKKAVEDIPDQSETEFTPFDQGLRALEQEKYGEAARIFDRLLVAKPATQVDLVILYNSGAAYEGLGNCQKASERYREVVRSSASKFKNIEGQALYRMSLMYECLGNDTKTITSLLDARKRGKELPWQTLNAEIPARLAAAYARMGNRKKAVEYFGQASEALKKLVNAETGKKQQELLGKTLFLMGQLNPAQRRAEGDPVIFLQGLSMQQPYLLQAAEIGHPNWSKRAADDLILAYDNIWRYKLPRPEQQGAFFTSALQTIRELKGIRMPGRADPTTDAIFAKVDAAESRLQNELAKVAETNRLTPEAQKREGLKREGRVVTPKPAPQPNKKKR
jgi:tetratricopeptide (TPR) repeat protein